MIAVYNLHILRRRSGLSLTRIARSVVVELYGNLELNLNCIPPRSSIYFCMSLPVAILKAVLVLPKFASFLIINHFD